MRVEWLPPAQQNLAEIVGYIAADNSVAVAYRVHGEITGQVVAWATIRIWDGVAESGEPANW